MTCLTDFMLRFLSFHSIRSHKTNSSYLIPLYSFQSTLASGISFEPHNLVRKKELLCLSLTMSSTHLGGPRKTETLFILQAESRGKIAFICPWARSVDYSMNTEILMQKFSLRQICKRLFRELGHWYIRSWSESLAWANCVPYLEKNTIINTCLTGKL